MKQLFTGLLTCLSYTLFAQQYLTVHISKLPDTHQKDTIYLTGNFNGWNPAGKGMHLRTLPDGNLGISIELKDVPSDRLEFKFTRGNWTSSECTSAGRLVGPRLAKLGQDTTIICEIEGWRDDYPASTVSKNVHLLDSAFYMPQLDRNRKIWIYLPEDYTQNTKSYPVIYMQDGQHLFDEATSQGRIGPIEWGVDETLDQSDFPCIIVAINHQDDFNDREAEFYFHPNEQFTRVEGRQYIDFIVQTLKPHIDRHYRTLPDKAHTAIAGSSLGGLVTFYAGLYHPETFGILGVFSPSIWLDNGNIQRDLENLIEKPSENNILNKAISSQHYYFYAGKQEFRRKPDGTFVHMQDDVFQAIKLLTKVAAPEIAYSENPDGRHGALFWKAAFPDFYNWFVNLAFKATKEQSNTKK